MNILHSICADYDTIVVSHQAQACKIDNLQTAKIAGCKVLTFFARVAVVDDYQHTREQIKLKILILGGSRQSSVGVSEDDINIFVKP